MIVIKEDAAAENKKVPWHHVPLQNGYAPFDWDSWGKNESYRNSIRGAYLSNPPGDHPRSYEESIAEFIERTGVQTVYRAIRIRSQSKNLANELSSVNPPNIEVDPDGNLFSDVPSTGMARAAEYQKLAQWPQDRWIAAANPFAEVLPIQHVSGDNYATQYISCACLLERARICSLTSYSAATGSNKIRRAYEWSPIIEIDLSQVADECKVVDLRDRAAQLRAGFFESDPRSHTIGALAEADQEILLTGRILGKAVTKILNAVAVVKMAQDELFDQAINSEGFTTYRDKPTFQHLAELSV